MRDPKGITWNTLFRKNNTIPNIVTRMRRAELYYVICSHQSRYVYYLCSDAVQLTSVTPTLSAQATPTT